MRSFLWLTPIIISFYLNEITNKKKFPCIFPIFSSNFFLLVPDSRVKLNADPDPQTWICQFAQSHETITVNSLHLA